MAQKKRLVHEVEVPQNPLSSVGALWDYGPQREEAIRTLKTEVDEVRAVTRRDYDKFTPKQRAEFDTRRRRIALASAVAGLPHLEAVNDLVVAALDRARYTGTTTQGGVMVEGEAGVGKSTTITEIANRVLLKELDEAYGDAWRGESPVRLRLRRRTVDGQTIEGQFVPVLVVSLHGSVGPKIFLELALKAYASIGVPVEPLMGKVRGADLADKLSNLMANCGTVLVVIDEVHFIRDSGNGTDTINYLKDLMNRTNAVFLMAGVRLDNGLQFLDGRKVGAQEQLSRRFTRQVIGNLPEPDKSADLRQVLKLMAWKTVLLDDPKSEWLTKVMVEYVYKRTGGVLQHVVALMHGAALLAIGRGERLSLGVFEQVQISYDAQKKSKPSKPAKPSRKKPRRGGRSAGNAR